MMSFFARSFFKSFQIKLNVPHQAVFDLISSSKDVTIPNFVLIVATGAYFLPHVINITGFPCFILFKSIKNIIPSIMIIMPKIISIVLAGFFTLITFSFLLYNKNTFFKFKKFHVAFII